MKKTPLLFAAFLFLFSSLISTGSSALTLKIATLAPAGTNWMKQMKIGAEAITEKTDGRVKIKFYPGGVMGNDQSVHRKIRINQLQGGAFSSSGLAHADNSIQALSLPMLFRSFEEVDYVRARMDERIKEHVAENGFIILGISEGGFARILSNRPISNMQDIRDTRVWIPEGDELSEQTFRTMGITPIPLPIADVFTGLQTGLIETIASTSTGAIAFQWHSKINHIVDIPVSYVIGILAVDRKRFNRIKPADQKIVIEEMNTVFANLDKINRQDNIDAFNALKSQGIASFRPPEDEIQRWQQFSEESIQDMINQGMVDKDIVDEILQLLAEYRQK
jgi:TRAP-type C4-dicarboxylate transport system substrate-binding protein